MSALTALPNEMPVHADNPADLHDIVSLDVVVEQGFPLICATTPLAWNVRLTLPYGETRH